MQISHAHTPRADAVSESTKAEKSPRRVMRQDAAIRAHKCLPARKKHWRRPGNLPRTNSALRTQGMALHFDFLPNPPPPPRSISLLSLVFCFILSLFSIYSRFGLSLFSPYSPLLISVFSRFISHISLICIDHSSSLPSFFPPILPVIALSIVCSFCIHHLCFVLSSRSHLALLLSPIPLSCLLSVLAPSLFSPILLSIVSCLFCLLSLSLSLSLSLCPLSFSICIYIYISLSLFLSFFFSLSLSIFIARLSSCLFSVGLLSASFLFSFTFSLILSQSLHVPPTFLVGPQSPYG